MKHSLLAAGLFLASVGTAHANEVFADPAIANGLQGATTEQQSLINDCLAPESSSRAIRACTKAIRLAPMSDAKSQLFTRRALHQMALGRFDRAADDFRRAGEMGGEDIASLGLGFSAMFNEDLETAQIHFADSSDSATVAHLAEYGMGLTYQMSGNTEQARQSYEAALEKRPGWNAVEAKLIALDD